MCCDCFICITSSILIFGIFSKVCCLNVWLACFVSHFLWTINSLSRPTLQISKGGVLSFFCLCCKVCIPYKVNINESWLCLSLTMHSILLDIPKRFHFCKMHAFCYLFFNGGYNLFMKRFFFASIILSHPQCSLILIFKFFL